MVHRMIITILRVTLILAMYENVLKATKYLTINTWKCIKPKLVDAFPYNVDRLCAYNVE